MKHDRSNLKPKLYKMDGISTTPYIINRLSYAWLKTNKKNDPTIFVVHNRGSCLAHVNIGCRHISAELHVFIQDSP